MGATVGVDVGHCVSFNVTVGDSVGVLDMLVGMKDVVLVFKSEGAKVSLLMVGASVALMVKLNSRMLYLHIRHDPKLTYYKNSI